MSRRSSRQSTRGGYAEQDDDDDDERSFEGTPPPQRSGMLGGGGAQGTNSDDHQIMAILAHMSQQQSASKPASPRVPPPNPYILPRLSSDLISNGSSSHSAVFGPSTTTSSLPFLPPTRPRPVSPTRNEFATHAMYNPGSLSHLLHDDMDVMHVPASKRSSKSFAGSSKALNASARAEEVSHQLDLLREKDGHEDGEWAQVPSKKGKGSDAFGEGNREEEQDELDEEDQDGNGRGEKKKGKASKDEDEAGTRTRKDNHKEVERRRRETINTGINALKGLVPGCEKNKGSILQRAVEYIHHLKQAEASNIEKWTLEKVLSDQLMVELKGEIRAWREHCEEMERENEELRVELGSRDEGKGGIDGEVRADKRARIE